MKKTLIFSDVHLKVTETTRAHQRDFIAFLRAINPDEVDRIICLGDLFDFWFEYRHVIFSGHFEVLRAFAELHEAGVELHLVCGNHDFWAGRFLRDELGFHIHQNTAALPFGERKALLAHGDGLNPTDYPYRIYKRFARNPFIIALFRCLHPDWAMSLARMVSHSSRTLTRTHDTSTGSEAKALRAFARGVLDRGEAEIVLCGHAHAPTVEEYDTPYGKGIYVNSGDWLHHRSHIIWDGHAFSLHNTAPAA